MKRFVLALVFLGLSVWRSWAYSSPGIPTGFVNDFANVLSTETKQQLESKLSSLDDSTSAQVTVVTIKSLSGDTIENYANKLFEEWGIGQKGKDNGVLLLVAVDDREVRIEVGYGLEGALTDAESSWIIRDKITPRFKEGNYDRGVIDGVDGILQAAAEDLQPISQEATFSTNFNLLDEGFPLIMFVFMGFQWLWAIMARTKSWWLGGVIGGVISLIIYIFAHSAFAFLAIPLGLWLDYLVSKQYKQSMTTGNYPWWIGGKSGFGGGFSGGRSGGFGGFGGGRSGGGGSSGGW